MEPKFQSSFIPKGPATSSSGAQPLAKGKRKGGLYGLIAMTIFIISLVAAAGVFGYKFYLKSNISQMGEDLRAAQTTLAVSETQEFIRLDNRLLSAESLIDSHVAFTPFFDFLETSTLQSVRFDEFMYQKTAEGIELSMNGEAQSFSAIALQSDVFNKSPNFINPSFSDLALDESGNVTFSFTALVNPELVSYKKIVEAQPPVVDLPLEETADEGATTTPATESSEQAATSTNPN